MARSCGLRIGARRFELIVLEGSPKKCRIAASAIGDFAPAAREPGAEAGDPAADAVATLHQAVKGPPAGGVRRLAAVARAPAAAPAPKQSRASRTIQSRRLFTGGDRKSVV